MLFLANCEGLESIVRLIKYGVLPVLYVGIGIVIIVLIIIDIAKAIVAGDEKEVKAAQKAAVRRLIYGVAIFFVVVLVNAVFNLLSSSGATTRTVCDEYGKCKEKKIIDNPTWYSCWTDIEKNS